MDRDKRKESPAAAGASPFLKATPRERLRELREKYIRSLPDTIGRIEAHWSRILEDRSNREELSSLCGMLHMLAGSAPSFGFSEVGEASRGAETLVRGILDGDATLEDGRWERIEAALDELLAASVTSRCEELAGRRFEESVPDSPFTRKEEKLIYIVDDDESLLQGLALQIGCFGFEVRAFSRITDFRKSVMAEEPAAIIMDLMFPEGQSAGADAVASLRKQLTRHVPVIFISQLDDFTSRLNRCARGATPIL
ncbi:MAG: response regulator [Geobacteraceae bacterium]|nr:response regulator [Geobacteraceae bacterium]